MTELNEKIQERFNVLKCPRSPLIVFDIDSTLMNTEPRNRAILEECGEHFPFLRNLMPELRKRDMGWNFPRTPETVRPEG